MSMPINLSSEVFKSIVAHHDLARKAFIAGRMGVDRFFKSQKQEAEQDQILLDLSDAEFANYLVMSEQNSAATIPNPVDEQLRNDWLSAETEFDELVTKDLRPIGGFVLSRCGVDYDGVSYIDLIAADTSSGRTLLAAQVGRDSGTIYFGKTKRVAVPNPLSPSALQLNSALEYPLRIELQDLKVLNGALEQITKINWQQL